MCVWDGIIIEYIQRCTLRSGLYAALAMDIPAVGWMGVGVGVGVDYLDDLKHKKNKLGKGTLKTDKRDKEYKKGDL